MEIPCRTSSFHTNCVRLQTRPGQASSILSTIFERTIALGKRKWALSSVSMELIAITGQCLRGARLWELPIDVEVLALCGLSIRSEWGFSSIMARRRRWLAPKPLLLCSEELVEGRSSLRERIATRIVGRG